jgi:hypothetical protein
MWLPSSVAPRDHRLAMGPHLAPGMWCHEVSLQVTSRRWQSSTAKPASPHRPAWPSAGGPRYATAFCGWMSRGACQGEDPELFFPIAAEGPALYQLNGV